MIIITFHKPWLFSNFGLFNTYINPNVVTIYTDGTNGKTKPPLYHRIQGCMGGEGKLQIYPSDEHSNEKLIVVSPFSC